MFLNEMYSRLGRPRDVAIITFRTTYENVIRIESEKKIFHYATHRSSPELYEDQGGQRAKLGNATPEADLEIEES